MLNFPERTNNEIESLRKSKKFITIVKIIGSRCKLFHLKSSANKSLIQILTLVWSI